MVSLPDPEEVHALMAQDAPGGAYNWVEVLAAGLRSKNFLLIDGELHLVDAQGFWTPATRGAATAALQTLFSGKPVTGSNINELMTQLAALPHLRPPWLESCHHSSTNRVALVQSVTGVVFDLLSGEVLTPAGVRETRTLAGSVPMVNYQPDLEPPPAVSELFNHFGQGLFDRIAWQLLGPHKTIDTVNLPVSDAGKSTLAHLIQRALPGGVAVLDAYNELRSTEFSLLRKALCENMLVFLDEADKVDTPPHISRINELTADSLLVNIKNLQARQTPRRANVILLGGGWPAINTGQGSNTRFRWAWAPEIPAMTPRLRDRLDTDTVAAWLGTWLVNRAASLTGDASTTQTTAWAAELRQETAEPLVAIMASLLVPTPGGFVGNAELKAAVEQHELYDNITDRKNLTNTRAWRQAIRMVSLEARRSRTADTRGWAEVSLTMTPQYSGVSELLGELTGESA